MPLSRDQIAKRIAKEIKPGFNVNLGIGIPTLCANHVASDMNVMFQSENGLMGVGPFPLEKDIDADLINAGNCEHPISHLMATGKTKEIIDELNLLYDVVIFDTPEAGKYIDAIPFMKWSDLNLYVVKADDTKSELINNAELIKEEYRLEEVHFVLNSIQGSKNHTGFIDTHKAKKNRKKGMPQLTSLFAW